MDTIDNQSTAFFPSRIICMTEEPTEVLYLLGEEHRIVGISGFTVRPMKARKEKPKVSAFTSADTHAILALAPDLVIGFSDIQADIARELISKGVTVWINNHRTVAEIFKMMVQLGSLVGKTNAALSLVAEIHASMKTIARKNHLQPRKPRIYFEEWYDPLIAGICWVSELIELAGGVDVHRHLQHAALAKDRIIAHPDDIIPLQPDIILVSWCGKRFRKERIVQRMGWDQIPAVQQDFIFEIKSPRILQPGPAAVTDGFQDIVKIIEQWHQSQGHE